MSRISEATVDSIAKKLMDEREAIALKLMAERAAHWSSEPVVKFTPLPTIIPESSLSEEERQRLKQGWDAWVERMGFQLESPKETP